MTAGLGETMSLVNLFIRKIDEEYTTTTSSSVPTYSINFTKEVNSYDNIELEFIDGYNWNPIQNFKSYFEEIIKEYELQVKYDKVLLNSEEKEKRLIEKINLFMKQVGKE